MEKVLDLGKTSVAGSFHLLIGVAGSNVIMAVGTIVLARLMSPAEYGVYAIALIPSLMFNLFRDWGVNSAITKYVANFRVRKNDEAIRDVIVAGVIFEVVVGLVLSLMSVFLAGFIASVIFHRPELASYIAIVSVTVVSGALLSAAQSSFVGFERMGLNSFTLIGQSVVKTVAGPILVVLGFSVLGAVLGYTLSILAAGIVSIVALYLVLFRPLRMLRAKNRNVRKSLKEMLKYGVPLSISSILGGILTQICAFVTASFVEDVMIGNYQAAVNFSVLLTFFTTPISTVLFPAFAKLNPQNEDASIRTVFASSVKYAAILVLPVNTAMMALSKPMIGTLFGERYVCAPFFLTIGLIGHFFVGLGSLSSGSLLSGLGETRTLMKQGLLNLTIGLPLGFLLIPSFGIVGLITASIVGGMPGMFWSLYWIWRHYGAKADFRSSAKILVASTLAGTISYFSLSVINMASWIQLVIGISLFLAVYILIAPIIGALSLNDINNLRAMFAGMRFVSKIVDIPLKVTEKVLLVKNSSKKEKSRDSKF